MTNGKPDTGGISEADLSRALRAAFDADADGDADAVGDADGDDPRKTLPGPRPFADLGGRYDLVEEIARGGMGVVLRGHDRDLGREVAVKILHESHADSDDLVRRFIDEARIAGQLQHPGIVPVYGLGVDEDERPCFAMRLVSGTTLSSLIRDDPGAGSLVRIFEQVCLTVGYAHSEGVVHRDLKPENVMVGQFGEVQVLDWGLAKVLGEPAGEETESPVLPPSISTVRGSEPGHATEVGRAVGTPGFMPPEQARGETAALDERADVFSLGAILTEILTGEPPYLGERAEVVRQSARGELDGAFRRLRACGTDPTLIDLAVECLAPAREDRPRDAKEVARRVSRYLSSLEERAWVAELAAEAERVRARGERKARRLYVALGGFVLFAVIVGGWAYLRNQHSRRDQLAKTEAGVREALEEAAHFAGRDEWGEAVESVRRAEALANTGQASDDIVATVAARLARYQQQAHGRDLTRRLEALRSGGDDSLFETGDDYAALYLDLGIDVSALSPDEVGERIRASGLDEVTLALGLDDWAAELRTGRGPPRGNWRHLVRCSKAADPDSWRDRLRDALLIEDVPALEKLAAELDVERPSPASLELLGQSLEQSGLGERAREVLLCAWERFPGDFRVNAHLARSFAREEEYRRATRHAWVCVSLRPDSVIARISLTRILFQSGDPETGIPVLKEAVRRSPKAPRPRLALAEALREVGREDEAEALLDGVDLRPPEGGRGPGGGRERAPGEGPGPGRGRRPSVFTIDAVDLPAELDRVLPRILEEPRNAELHARRGEICLLMGRFDDAREACAAAVRLDPDFARAHSLLATALLECGRYEDAAAAWRSAGEAGESSELVEPAKEECGSLAEAAAWIDAFLADGELPADSASRSALARVLLHRDRTAAAHRVFQSVHLSRGQGPTARGPMPPPLDLLCAAALAGSGIGEDAIGVTEEERVELRSLALDIVRSMSERAHGPGTPSTHPDGRSRMSSRLLHDVRLAPLRDPDRLLTLSEHEQRAWNLAWSELDSAANLAESDREEDRPTTVPR